MNNIIYVQKPWGDEKIWAKTDKYVGKILTIKSGHKLSRQYHNEKDETIYVLKGDLMLEIGKDDNMEKLLLVPGSCYRIYPNTVHRFIAGDYDCVLLEVSTPELDDVVRLEDDYDRAKYK